MENQYHRIDDTYNVGIIDSAHISHFPEVTAACWTAFDTIPKSIIIDDDEQEGWTILVLHERDSLLKGHLDHLTLTSRPH